MITRQHNDANKIADTLHRITPSVKYSPNDRFVILEEKAEGFSVGTFLAAGMPRSRRCCGSLFS